MRLPEVTLPDSGDISECCGKPTVVVEKEISTRMVVGRKLIFIIWQCQVVFEHQGQGWRIPDREGLEHHNIFEEDDNGTNGSSEGSP